MSALPLVSYFDGMFANEPRADSFFSTTAELEATCYHEASHAVAKYLYAMPIKTVGVSASYSRDNATGGLMVAYGGEVKARGKSAVTIDYPYRRSHFAHGLITAAGPAGERRYRHEVEIPQRLLGASEGDHRDIDAIAKCLERRGRNRYAFQRMVWYAAQRLVADTAVWAAISAIADDLFQCQGQDLDQAETGTVWIYMTGSDVYAWCRRSGLRRGMYRAA